MSILVKRMIWMVVSISLALFVVVTGCSSVPSANESQQESDVAKDEVASDSTQKIEYELVNKEDISIGVAKRFEYRIVVPTSADEEYLKNVAKDIIDNEEPMNAAVFGFYDRKEDAEGAYTIGKVTWAPFGDLARASEVKTGDYSKHQMVVEVNEKIDISSEEFAIHDEIKQILKGPGNPYDENPPAGEDTMEWMAKQSEKIEQWEEKAFETVAKKYNITPQEAKEIYLRVEMR